MGVLTVVKAKSKTVVIKTGGSTKTELKTARREPSDDALGKTGGAGENFYENAIKEVQVLAQNDTYSRKIDAGVLNEARGKDVWHLHTTLKAVDDIGTTLWSGITDVNSGVRTGTRQVTELVERTRDSTREAVNKAQSTLTDRVDETTSKLDGAVQKVHQAVTSGFNKLAQATAGTEENLRTQTHAFSKEVATLLAELQGTFDKTIREFRDETTRLIDKRFNQSDVAFAAVRADQEVVKALLTDIIKDRMGRSEPRGR